MGSNHTTKDCNQSVSIGRMQSWLAKLLSPESGTIGTWVAALIALITLVVSLAKRAGVPYKWDSIVQRVGFFLCMAGLLNPTTPEFTRGGLGLVMGYLLVAIGQGARQERERHAERQDDPGRGGQ